MITNKLIVEIKSKINDNQKQGITGGILQGVLLDMVESLSEAYPQIYTQEQKAQARANIDALSDYDGAITKEKLSAEVQAILADVANKQNITDETLATIAKTIDGAINEVYNGGLKDASIATSKIEDGAITDAKIASGAVTTPKIANDAVTTEKVNDGAITEPKLDADLVNVITSAVQPADLASAIATALASYVAKADIVDTTGSATDKVMSQHGVTEAIDGVTNKVTELEQEQKRTTQVINLKKIVLPNDSLKSFIPTTSTPINGGNYKSYEYDVENIKFVDIYSNISADASPAFATAVLWALYKGKANAENLLAYGPLLSTGEQHGFCDLSLYPDRKILRVITNTLLATPITEVSYDTTDFVTHDEVNDVLRITDVIDSLDSEYSDKPLSAKQGKILNEKLTMQEALPPVGDIKSTIPTNTGVRISGGNYGALLYDVTNSTKLSYLTDAQVPEPGQYDTAVVWALYSSSMVFDETTVLAVGDLLSAGKFNGIIDLSQYPTAVTLLLTCYKATAAVSVNKEVERYATKQEIELLDERVDALEADSQVVSIVLPNKIHAVKGDRLQVFYRGAIACLNPNIYNIKALCDVGKAYPRYLHFEASSANVGTSKNLQLLVEGSNGIVKAQGSVPIMTINTPSSPTSNKNILVFGASLLGTGSVVNELKRRLTETSGSTGDRSNPKGLGLSNITFVGRKRGSAYDVPQEATGGWSWAEYATQGRLAYRFNVSGVIQLHPGDVYSDGSHTYTIAEINVTDGSGNIRCLGYSAPTSTSGTLSLSKGSGDATITYSSYTAENYSPFYNSETNQIDFVNYANAYCNGSIDIIIAHCGTNDIFGGNIENVSTTYNSYIKPFIRKYHEQFPNGKFILSTLPLPDMNGGLAASYGAGPTANWWRGSQNYYEFARLAYELEADSEFSSYVTVANVMHLFDAENLYIYADVPVANRLPGVKERLGQNGVHPSGSGGSFVIGDSEAGTKTIADALYYAVCANLI